MKKRENKNEGQSSCLSSPGEKLKSNEKGGLNLGKSKTDQTKLQSLKSAATGQTSDVVEKGHNAQKNLMVSTNDG